MVDMPEEHPSVSRSEFDRLVEASRDNVGREEFDTFSKNVSSSFRDLADGLRELRADLRQMATRGTDWKAIWSGLGVCVAILGLVGALVAWGLNDRVSESREDIRLIAGVVRENTLTLSETSGTATTLQGSVGKLETQFDGRLRDLDSKLERDVTRVLDWQISHDQRVVAINAKQEANINNFRQMVHLLMSKAGMPLPMVDRQ